MRMRKMDVDDVQGYVQAHIDERNKDGYDSDDDELLLKLLKQLDRTAPLIVQLPDGPPAGLDMEAVPGLPGCYYLPFPPVW